MGVDFWDFDCRYGATVESASAVHVSEIIKRIDEAQSQGLESFYLEILAKPGHRTQKPTAADDED